MAYLGFQWDNGILVAIIDKIKDNWMQAAASQCGLV